MNDTNRTFQSLEAELLEAGIPEKSVAFIVGVLVGELNSRMLKELTRVIGEKELETFNTDSLSFDGTSDLEKQYSERTNGLSLAEFKEQQTTELINSCMPY